MPADMRILNFDKFDSVFLYLSTAFQSACGARDYSMSLVLTFSHDLEECAPLPSARQPPFIKVR
jgi:hypothetical protein